MINKNKKGYTDNVKPALAPCKNGSRHGPQSPSSKAMGLMNIFGFLRSAFVILQK